uniref:Uncharacterized protein n=1 Tax=Pristionchus pacificus TaxID=54126 RepID=A0A2A6CVZ3_PRIPA|eukprot:PDM82402.1 hypothetical protein PRIPAC_36795 [Pristionchus pacificus]
MTCEEAEKNSCDEAMIQNRKQHSDWSSDSSSLVLAERRPNEGDLASDTEMLVGSCESPNAAERVLDEF